MDTFAKTNDMEIKIPKAEIFNEVEKRSSIEGYIIPERFDNVWADETRGEILNSYWIEGYTAVIQLLKRYLSKDSVTYDLSQYDGDEVLTIEAVMPERYNTLLNGSVETDIKMMLACNILHGWLEVVSPEAAAKYDEEANGYSEDLRVKLLYRTSPTKSFSESGEDEVAMCGCDSGMEYPDADEEPLKQLWGCCRIR
jgi:hypothetical protein